MGSYPLLYFPGGLVLSPVPIMFMTWVDLGTWHGSLVSCGRQHAGTVLDGSTGYYESTRTVQPARCSAPAAFRMRLN
jgi:hypothetical protein